MAAISGDGKQIILEPIVEITMEGMDMSKSSMSGWLLFDVDKGIVGRSYGMAHMEMDLSQAGEGVTITNDTEIFYHVE